MGRHALPHRAREHVAGSLFDEQRKLVFGVHRLINLLDCLDTAADVVDRAAAIGFAKVEVERPRGDEGGDVGRVAVLMKAWNEVGKAVQHLLLMNGGVSWQATVADEGLQSRLPRSDEPRMRGTHRMTIAAEALGVHFRTAGQIIDGPPHVQNVLPGEALAVDRVLEEQVPLEIAAFKLVSLLALTEAER